jgi:DNA-binding transcriptional LysR family regulator
MRPVNLFDAYRYLAALEQHRHFGRAAAACHITQPALSNALRSLEAQLGTAIVRRSRHYEGLTAEGERVLATAHRVLHEQELLAQDLASAQGQPQGRLLIGTVPTAVPLAARFAARLIERHPGLRPQVRSLSSQDIESGLDRLAIDLGLGFTDRLASGAAAPLQPWPQRRGRSTGPPAPSGRSWNWPFSICAGTCPRPCPISCCTGTSGTET